MKELFVARIGCMDGREAEAVRTYVKEHRLADFVDTIDDPGMVKRIVDGDGRALEKLEERLPITIEKHGSSLVIVSGHAECAGNPVSPEEHKTHILAATDIVRRTLEKSGYRSVSVVPLFADRDVSGRWSAEQIG